MFSNVGMLREAGLDVPQATELSFELKKEGIDLGNGILTVSECVEAMTETLREEI